MVTIDNDLFNYTECEVRISTDIIVSKCKNCNGKNKTKAEVPPRCTYCYSFYNCVYEIVGEYNE